MNLKTGRKSEPEKNKSIKKYKKKRKRRVKRSQAARAKAAGKRVAGSRRIVKVLGILLAVTLVVWLVLMLFYFLNNRKEEALPSTESMEPVESDLQEPVDEIDMGSDVLSHIITAGNAVRDSYQKRPQSHEVTLENAADFAEIAECIINESGRVSVKIEGDGIPKSDDKYYYLFALNTYDTLIPEDGDYISRDYKDNETVLTAALNYNSSNSRLYKKFVAAVKLDGKYVQVSAPSYITNPEAIARYTGVYQQPSSKKGLLVDPNKLRGSELDDLGVKQAAYNIPVARLLGPTTSAVYPSIQYTYNGRTYTFNGQVIAEYDLVFSTLTAKGISTTAIILNNYSSAYPQITHPKARSGSTAPYCMFNGAEESGVEYMAAIGSFLAERYSDNRHGRISNWVIANEINARKEWNYMPYTDIETYVEEYARAFRVFYNAIKSVSSSARVYVSIDQQWDRNIKNNTNYDGRDILDVFNANISAKGNIDWGVAQHPYNVPLTEARTWKDSKYIEHHAGTSMLSMANIEVLVNYLKQEQFLTNAGDVRSILLSEQGYTASAGEAYQAAAFAYAYYKVEHYEEIDGFLLNRQTDAPEEVAQGLAFGLNNGSGGHRQIYNVFKYIDTSEHTKYTDFAKNLIGISSWNEIMR